MQVSFFFDIPWNDVYVIHVSRKLSIFVHVYLLLGAKVVCVDCLWLPALM